MTAPWRRFPLEGFVFGAGYRQVGLVEDRGVRVEASVATMMMMSDVGDVAVAAVVGSSPACPWGCLGVFCC